MLRIVHVADLHFGRRMTTVTQGGENTRELDIYRAGDLVAQHIAHSLQPDIVVVAGDVFDTPNPGPLAVRHGFDFHQTLRSADIPVIVIGGNHDTLTSIYRPSPLEHLRRYFDCRVVMEQESFEMLGVRWGCIPYRSISTGMVEAPEWSQGAPNILVAHATADGASLPDFAAYDRTRLPRAISQDKQICLGLLGHIHIHQEVLANTYYSGAIERLTWGEIENQPSIYIHELAQDGSVNTQSLPLSQMGNPMVPRPGAHLQIDCSTLDAAQSVDAAESKVGEWACEGGMLQLTLQSAPREINALPYEDTLQQRARKQGLFALKLRAQCRQTNEVQFESQGPSPGATLAEAYKSWMQEKNDHELAQLGSQLIGGEAE